MQGKPVDLYGDGTQSRDFTYVKTVVDIAIDAMEYKVTTQGAVNLAYGNRIFLSEVVDLLRSEFPNLKVNYLPIRAGDVKESQNSPELIKSLFPNVTPYQFKEALKETIDWLRVEGSTIANGPKVSD
jgi:UDP-glucose 4-epimerase